MKCLECKSENVCYYNIPKEVQCLECGAVYFENILGEVLSQFKIKEEGYVPIFDNGQIHIEYWSAESSGGEMEYFLMDHRDYPRLSAPTIKSILIDMK